MRNISKCWVSWKIADLEPSQNCLQLSYFKNLYNRIAWGKIDCIIQWLVFRRALFLFAFGVFVFMLWLVLPNEFQMRLGNLASLHFVSSIDTCGFSSWSKLVSAQLEIGKGNILLFFSSTWQQQAANTFARTVVCRLHCKFWRFYTVLMLFSRNNSCSEQVRLKLSGRNSFISWYIATRSSSIVWNSNRKSAPPPFNRRGQKHAPLCHTQTGVARTF